MLKKGQHFSHLTNKSEMMILWGCLFLKKQKCKLAHAIAAIKPEHIHTLINDSSIAFLFLLRQEQSTVRT